MAKAERADILLVKQGLCASREEAKRMIMAGAAFCETEQISKPGTRLAEDAKLRVKEKRRFVGRGGLKLEKALEEFCLNVEGLTCLDIGASTGGFTDCLLQRGASKVYSIDVGRNQLAWKLRQDERVISREKVNARYLKKEDIPEPIDLTVMDLSFISLTKVLPAIFSIMTECRLGIVCLIKPQFELSREEVGKGGVVKNIQLQQQAVQKIRNFVDPLDSWTWESLCESPIHGADGNIEFLAYLKPSS